MLARGVPGDGAIRAVQDAAQTELANAGSDQLALLSPPANPGYSGDVKEDVCHSPVVLCNRIYKHAERLVDGRIRADCANRAKRPRDNES